MAVWFDELDFGQTCKLGWLALVSMCQKRSPSWEMQWTSSPTVGKYIKLHLSKVSWDFSLAHATLSYFTKLASTCSSWNFGEFSIFSSKYFKELSSGFCSTYGYKMLMKCFSSSFWTVQLWPWKFTTTERGHRESLFNTLLSVLPISLGSQEVSLVFVR